MNPKQEARIIQNIRFYGRRWALQQFHANLSVTHACSIWLITWLIYLPCTKSSNWTVLWGFENVEVPARS